MPRFNMKIYKNKNIPLEKDFGHNEALRREVFETIEPDLNDLGYTYTEEEKNAIINNQERLDKFNKFRVITERVDKQIAILKEFEKQYKIRMIGPFQRVGFSLMKVPTPNATPDEIKRIHKENVDTFLKYSDPRNTEKLCRDALDYCVNYDVTKFSNLTPDKAYDLYLEDDRINFLFCLNSMLATSAGGNFRKRDELDATLTKITSVIENGITIQTLCELSASALDFLLPEEMVISKSTMLVMNLKDKVTPFIQNGITGFTLRSKNEQGLLQYNKKCMTTLLLDEKVYDKQLEDIVKEYGKDFLKKYEYQGKSLGDDLRKISHVKKALEVYDLMHQPDLTLDQREKYQSIWNCGKSDLMLVGEKDEAKVKAALEDFMKNFKPTFVKKTDAEIENTFHRVFKTDNLVEIMSNEREDFRTQKSNGNTTLAAEVNTLAKKAVTQEDTSDLLRVYGEVKTRIDNRKWYSYFAFWNIRKQNGELRTIEAKIIESGNSVDSFSTVYNELKLADKLEAARANEKLTGSNYVGREAYNEKYTVKSERIMEAKNEVQEAMDLAENTVRKNAEVLEEPIEINNDINTNTNEKQPEEEIEITL